MTTTQEQAPVEVLAEVMREFDWKQVGRQLTRDDYERAATAALLAIGYVDALRQPQAARLTEEDVALRLAKAERALEPFARLDLPKGGNAGAYSIKADWIKAARACEPAPSSPKCPLTAAPAQVTPDDILSLLYCFNYKLPGGFFKQLPHESLVQLRDAIMSLLASRGLVKEV